MLINPERGKLQITDTGISVLSLNIDRIGVDFLKQFTNSNDLANFSGIDKADNGIITEIETHTPEELMETSFNNIKDTLAKELLEKVRNISPSSFEKLVVNLLVKIGYGGSIEDAGKAIGKTRDEGIDGIIKEDKLGLDVIYIQAKNWNEKSVVGRPELQKFVGALAGKKAKKGVFITSSKFTKDALEYSHATETKILLIDSRQLAELMI
jgi:restriction system protein